MKSNITAQQQQPRRKRTKPCFVDLPPSPPPPTTTKSLPSPSPSPQDLFHNDNNDNTDNNPVIKPITDCQAGPTILIAPEDYIHIYKGKTTEDLNEIPKDVGRIESEINNNTINDNNNKTNQQLQQQQAIDNTPTVMIAPKDYIHIYKQPKSNQNQ